MLDWLILMPVPQQYTAIASRVVKSGMVMLSERKKHVLSHSCEPLLAGARRKYNMKTLNAVPALAGALMNKISDAAALRSAFAAISLPAPSLQSTQSFLRSKLVTSFERHVLELLLLPQFVAAVRAIDLKGMIDLETRRDNYNSVEVDVFHRLFFCLGAHRIIVSKTAVLPFLAVDGAHLRRVFGGIMLVAVMPTANRQLCPLAVAFVESESEESCVWFATRLLSCYPGVHFVWMMDQGSALTSAGMCTLLDGADQVRSTCAKHLMATLTNNRNRSEGEIKGPLKGVQYQLYQLAKSRSSEAAEDVLAKIKALNPTVEVYLRDRLDLIASFALLEIDADGEIGGRRRGGRITTQLAESLNNALLKVRSMGIISGLIWMVEWCRQQAVAGRKSALHWTSSDYRGDRIPGLAPNVSKNFIAVELSKNTQYSVESFQERDLLVLTGLVVKQADQSSSRFVTVRRDYVGGKVTILCNCRTRQEYGYPCSRAVKLIQTANGMPGTKGKWVWHSKEFFAEFTYLSTWEQQLQLLEMPVLSAPSDLPPNSVPVKAKEVQLVVERTPVGTNRGPFPARILKTAGRPPELRITRRKLADHHQRFKSAAEPSGKRQRNGDESLQDAPGLIAESDGDDVDAQGDDVLDDEQAGIDEMPIGSSYSEADLGGGDEEDIDSDQEEAAAVADNLAPPDPGDALMDTRAGRDVTFKRPPQCGTCGNRGHRWPSCKDKSVEFVLANLGAIPPVDPALGNRLNRLPPPPPPPRLMPVQRALSPASQPPTPEVITERPADLPSPSPPESHEPVASANHTLAAEKRPKMIRACTECEEELPQGSGWRQLVVKCRSCSVEYAHTACVAARHFRCSTCSEGALN